MNCELSRSGFPCNIKLSLNNHKTLQMTSGIFDRDAFQHCHCENVLMLDHQLKWIILDLKKQEDEIVGELSNNQGQLNPMASKATALGPRLRFVWMK